jgi:rubredoxin
MVRKNYIIKINLLGGIISSGSMYTIMCAAEEARIEDVRFGARQQMLCIVNEKYLDPFLEALKKGGITYDLRAQDYPNIVSSYVTEEVFHKTGWLSEGVYKDILDQFDYRPRLKININDSGQTFVPFFTGNINFISSPISNYWYLDIRFPRTTICYKWPELIYSEDIARISKIIEEKIYEYKDIFFDRDIIDAEALYKKITEKETFITQPVTQELQVPEFDMPYYEGVNRYGNKTWLGIYRRDECYSVAFLKDVSNVCLKTKIGQLYTTPWKSIVIKGISDQDRKSWSYILNEHRINVRHASNELNWQIEDMSEESLVLKRFLIRLFDKEDLRTYGLCFAIQTKPKTGLFASVVIRKLPNQSGNKYKMFDRYDILYTADFNPNSTSYVLFRENVAKDDLETYLIALCKYYYEVKNESAAANHAAFRHQPILENAIAASKEMVHQCSYCFTIYDEHYGDTVNDIPAGTSFSELSINYTCPTCGASKGEFNAVESPTILT